MILGISHITLTVSDLERSSDFLKTIFDAREVYVSREKQFSVAAEKFFLIGDIWICIMEGEPLKERTYHHIAFRIPEEDFDVYTERIKAFGIEIRSGRPRIAGEGRSVYFYDSDNHLFELHTGTLENRLNAYADFHV